MKNIKIGDITEAMFSQAITLSQSGRMKNTIHVGGKNIFIKNMDNTILLRFDSEQEFSNPFSFHANDYESSKLGLQEKKVVFISHSKGFDRRKECVAPKDNYADVRRIWRNHQIDTETRIEISENIVPLLDEGLSHIELFKKKNENYRLIQRDIYTGAKIEICENVTMPNLLMEKDENCFDTIGIRTVDFIALFTFVTSLIFYFQSNQNWIYFEDSKGKLSGILSTCLYDEIGYISSIKGG